MTQTSKTVYIVSHTHWDREWYLPFHQFRVKLLETVDCVLGLLGAESGYEHFVLDGQAIILQDYLEIYPEQKERIERLVQAKKLSIGPWYILPDEFLVSAESTIRNVIIGHQICAEFGGVQKVGYMPDSFGHIAQMPQILRQAGIDSFIYTRGSGDELDELGAVYTWAGPDGSEVLAVNQSRGYCNAGALGYSESWYNNTNRVFQSDLAIGKIREMLQDKKLCHNNIFLFNNGCDHFFPQPEIPQLIESLQGEFPDVEFKHSDFGTFLEDVKKAVPAPGRFAGELRGGKHHHILPGVWSARIYLKQLNDYAQTLLEKVAEPLSVYVWLQLGEEYPSEVLKYCWKLLLKNHPHDSICGCSTDEVHREMIPRFEGVIQTAEQLIRQTLETIAPTVGQTENDDKIIVLTLFNPLPFQRTEVVERLLILPKGISIEEYELLDENGKKVPFEILHNDLFESFWAVDFAGEIYTYKQRELFELYKSRLSERFSKASEGKEKYPSFATIQFMAEKIPALGHVIYRLRHASSPIADLKSDGVIVSGNSMSNDLLRVVVHPNGTFDLHDKETDIKYEALNLLESTEDIGDEYDYSPAENSKTIDAREGRGKIEIVENSGLSGKLRVEFDLVLPVSISESRKNRSEKTASCRVKIQIGLKAWSRLVEVKTCFDNQAKDHRLRAIFPTPIQTDKIISDGHFYINERNIETPKVENWVQAPTGTHPQQAFSLVHNGQAGLAVLNKGLPEVEGMKDHEGNSAIALTLLRAVGWLSREDGLYRKGNAGPMVTTPEAQCLGEQIFEYAIMPFSGDHVEASISAISDRYKSAVIVKQGVFEETQVSSSGLLQHSSKITAISAIKKHRQRESVIVRIHNLKGETVGDKLKWGMKIDEAWRTDLLEERQERIEPVEEFSVGISLRAHEIMTIEFVLK